MTWIRRLVLLGIGLVLVLALVGLFLPRTVRVERSITINAPQAAVFGLATGFQQFNKWSPWFELDPKASYTYDGPAEGVGAKMTWAGDAGTIGSGSQEITGSRPYDEVTTRVAFGNRDNATLRFKLKPEAGGTLVVWSLETDLGANPFGRYLGLLIDRLVGGDFEKGLARLKTLAEAGR